MSISGTFNPATGVLTSIAGSGANLITESRDVAGTIILNGDAVPITGGAATVANANQTQEFGQGGIDTSDGANTVMTMRNGTPDPSRTQDFRVN